LKASLHPNESLVSVVIPVYNNETTIEKCLSSIFESTYKNFEVIVVDDGSKDRTVEIAKKFNCTLIQLKENAGVGFARNAGAKKGKGTIIFFTDGDVTIRQDTLEMGVKTLLGDSSACAVVGAYSKNTGVNNFFSAYKQLTLHYLHLSSPKYISIFVGCCGFIKKDVFNAINGFDEKSFARKILEDVDLGMRLFKQGHRILLSPQIQVVHHKHYSFYNLMVSDMFNRAIPWSRLILKHKIIQFELSTRKSDLICVVLAYFLIASIFLPLFISWRSTALIVLSVLFAYLIADSKILNFYFKEKNLIFTLKSIFMRLCFFTLSSIGAGIGFLINFFERK
jgi:glycosyltransferase involved in cell wall biosynthesis